MCNLLISLTCCANKAENMFVQRVIPTCAHLLHANN